VTGVGWQFQWSRHTDPSEGLALTWIYETLSAAAGTMQAVMPMMRIAVINHNRMFRKFRDMGLHVFLSGE